MVGLMSAAVTYGDSRLPEHFWRKVAVCPERGCWLWVAGKSSDGYGRFASGPGFIADSGPFCVV